jgi:hypothetical protein
MVLFDIEEPPKGFVVCVGADSNSQGQVFHPFGSGLFDVVQGLLEGPEPVGHDVGVPGFKEAKNSRTKSCFMASCSSSRILPDRRPGPS